MLETNFSHKKCLSTPCLCNDDQKGWYLFWWGVQNPWILVVSWGADHFSASQHPPPPNLQKRFISISLKNLTTSHQISSQKINRKIFFLNKIQKSTR